MESGQAVTICAICHHVKVGDTFRLADETDMMRAKEHANFVLCARCQRKFLMPTELMGRDYAVLLPADCAEIDGVGDFQPVIPNIKPYVY